MVEHYGSEMLDNNSHADDIPRIWSRNSLNVPQHVNFQTLLVGPEFGPGTHIEATALSGDISSDNGLTILHPTSYGQTIMQSRRME